MKAIPLSLGKKEFVDKPEQQVHVHHVSRHRGKQHSHGNLGTVHKWIDRTRGRVDRSNGKGLAWIHKEGVHPVQGKEIEPLLYVVTHGAISSQCLNVAAIVFNISGGNPLLAVLQFGIFPFLGENGEL